MVHVLWVVGALVIGYLSAVATAALFLLVQNAIVRPWDTSKRSHDYAYKTPWPVMQLVLAQRRLAEYCNWSLLPAPMRIADVATLFTHSQVLFVLVHLRIPDLLRQMGPCTARQLAKAAGAPDHDYVSRVLAFAAHLGLLAKSRRRVAGEPPNVVVATAVQSESMLTGLGADAGMGLDQAPKKESKLLVKGGAAQAEPEYENVYRMNACTAALCEDHPASMAAFVRLMGDHYNETAPLSQAVQEGRTSFAVWHEDKYGAPDDFWDWLNNMPDKAANFDAAMKTTEHFGAGYSPVADYRGWANAALVVDVGGGVGSFVARILGWYPSVAQGVVFDRAGQVERAAKFFEQQPERVRARTSFAPGDMFNASTIPRPAEDGPTIYTMRMILHDWGEEDCRRALLAIRAAASANASKHQVRLVLVEMALLDEHEHPGGAATLAARYASDVLMMSRFGGGKERSGAQFRTLLAGAGWKLQRIVPTNSIYYVVEAVPM